MVTYILMVSHLVREQVIELLQDTIYLIPVGWVKKTPQLKRFISKTLTLINT